MNIEKYYFRWLISLRIIAKVQQPKRGKLETQGNNHKEALKWEATMKTRTLMSKGIDVRGRRCVATALLIHPMEMTRISQNWEPLSGRKRTFSQRDTVGTGTSNWPRR